MPAVIALSPGTRVSRDGETFTVIRAIDLQEVLARNDATAQAAVLRAKDLRPLPREDPPKQLPLEIIDDEAWIEARRRHAIIQPLIDHPRTEVDIRKVAAESGVSRSSIYRWLRLYELEREVAALRPIGNRSRRGKTRLTSETEAVISSTLDSYYLTPQRHSIEETCEEIEQRCRRAGLSPPARSSVRRRVRALDPLMVAQRRGERRRATALRPKRGAFHLAEYPLAIVQIDHTPADIILVDEQSRRPLARPWITVAIDVYSRVITGFYVSFDKPNLGSVGSCIWRSIVAKEQFLTELGLDTSWDVSGFPHAIHVDNAREFRSLTLKRACQNNNIIINFRPGRRPEFGAHIERLLGTFMDDIHELAGTTFSSLKERGDYDSEKKAALTLSDFEKWLTQLITGVYHQRPHSGIGGISPIKRFQDAMLGTLEHPGPGRTLVFDDDSRKLELDFMASFYRKIRSTGVRIDNVWYQHEVLGSYVGPTGKSKSGYFFRRDPRDISVVYFEDPEREMYWTIPFADTKLGPISIWEYRRTIADLRSQGVREIDAEAIFAERQKLKDIEQAAVVATKRQRREEQRQSAIRRTRILDETASTEENASGPPMDVEPFDEVQW